MQPANAQPWGGRGGGAASGGGGLRGGKKKNVQRERPPGAARLGGWGGFVGVFFVGFRLRRPHSLLPQTVPFVNYPIIRSPMKKINRTLDCIR